jgi:pyruvate kinase
MLRHMEITSVTASVQVAASIIAEKLKARWVISITEGGNSCLKMTRFRPKTPVLGVTSSLNVVRKMCLYWGITPYYYNIYENADLTKLGGVILERMKRENLLQLGDKVVMTVGDGKFFQQGTTNSIHVETIKDLPKALKNTDQDSIQEVSSDRGKFLLDTSICASCQACINVCPFDIWTSSIENNNETRINAATVHRCVFDMACVEACPTGAIEIIPFDS